MTYACPMGYCQCCVEDQGAIAICLFSVNSMDLNSQCANNRKGSLEVRGIGTLGKIAHCVLHLYVHVCVCSCLHTCVQMFAYVCACVACMCGM